MKPTISVCMITKNEEHNLTNCLNSVKNIVDEIIIVDTGSTDKTKDIAKKFCEMRVSSTCLRERRASSRSTRTRSQLTAKIFDFRWVDDFSAARNESLKHATKQWILVLDADEVLDKEGIKTIKDLINDKGTDAYLFLQKNYSSDTSIAGFVNEEHIRYGKKYAGWYGSFIARLFRNKKEYKFEGTVHELVEPSIESKKGKIAATNIVIHHYGNAEPNIVKKKRTYYLELCKKKVKQTQSNVSESAWNARARSRSLNSELTRMSHASSYYELGVLYKENDNFDDAIKSFKKVIELNPKHSMALYELGIIYEKQKDYNKAIKNYTESLRVKESSEAFQNLGVCYLKKSMLKEAYRNLVKAMLLNPNKYTIYNNLGAVLEKIGNYESAVQMLDIATKLNPKNKIGFYNLGIALDKKGAFGEAIQAYEKAIGLEHPKSEEIKKRVKQLKNIIVNLPSYKYGFKVGG